MNSEKAPSTTFGPLFTEAQHLDPWPARTVQNERTKQPKGASLAGRRALRDVSAVVLGQTAMLASALASLAVGGLALGFLYVAGAFVLLVGLALLSVATYRAAILPHWSAYLVAALAMVVFGEIGMVPVGLVWIALGCVLWSERGATAGQPSRVR